MLVVHGVFPQLTPHPLTTVELVRRPAHRRPHRRQYRQHPLCLFLPRHHGLARRPRPLERRRRTRSDRRADIHAGRVVIQRNAIM